MSENKGSEPVKKIALGKPVFDEKEKEALAAVCDSPWVLNGPKVRAFEEAFSAKTGAPYAASVSNCTAGMHLSLAAYGFAADDEVLLPAFNFTADGLSVLQAGLKPVFVDVSEKTANMCPESLESKITPKSKAILALHYAGRPSNMDAILKIAKEHDLKVVEDASHALGATYRGVPVGNLGDATVFSFGPLKMICTGMGGMVTSRDEAFHRKIASLRSYGMNKSMWSRKTDPKPWQYAIAELGHNFRMTDFQAAMGLVQLEKLDGFVARRNEIAERYDESLADLPLFELLQLEDHARAAHLYYAVKVRSMEKRDALAAFLQQQGIGVSVHWDPPLHRHPLYEKFGYQENDFPRTEKLSQTMISLPLHPDLSDDDMDRILSLIQEFCSREATHV